MNRSGFMPSPAPGMQSFDAKPRSEERTWRVGSLSMGVTLMLIGTAFAVSLWQDADVYRMLLWVAPVVFILLGGELLLHLALYGKRDMIIRYDWLSIFFVGIMGAASLILALLMSSGLFDELKRNMDTTLRTVYVDTDAIEIPEQVTKVVVQSAMHVEFKETTAREVRVMGQVRYHSPDKPETLHPDLVQWSVVGDTLFLIVGEVERRDNGFAPDYTRTMLMVAFPEGIIVENWSLQY